VCAADGPTSASLATVNIETLIIKVENSDLYFSLFTLVLSRLLWFKLHSGCNLNYVISSLIITVELKFDADMIWASPLVTGLNPVCRWKKSCYPIRIRSGKSRTVWVASLKMLLGLAHICTHTWTHARLQPTAISKDVREISFLLV
jgi:hypothetical protein